MTIETMRNLVVVLAFGACAHGAPTGGGGGGEPREPAPPQGAQPAHPAQPAAADKGEKKPEGEGDDAAARFSLLELD
jgi:hypothetical protein